MLLAPIRAWAAESDAQLWSTISASAPISASVNGVALLSQRFRSTAAGGNQWLAQGALDVKAAKGLSVGFGFTYANALTKELRASQQVTWTIGMLAVRSQIEERFFDGHTQMGLRLRERAQLRVPLDRQDQLTLSGEALFVLRPTTIGSSTGLNQVRFIVADEHKLTRHLGLTMGYQMIYAPNKGSVDKISHIPQLTLSWKG